MSDRERRLQEYLDNRLDAADRDAFEQETLASEEMSEELMNELALRDLLARRRRPRRRSPLRQIGAAAAGMAAVVALLLLWPRGEVPESVLRGDDPSTVEVLEPTGELSAPPSAFRWLEFEGATTYRVEVFDGAGVQRLEHAVTGTSFVPDTEVAMPDTGYWMVTAFDEVGLEIGRSGPVRFEINPARD